MRYLTDEELNKAKEIRVAKRSDALKELSKILNESLGCERVLANAGQCIKAKDCKIDITTRKDKTTGLVMIKAIDVIGDSWKTYRF